MKNTIMSSKEEDHNSKEMEKFLREQKTKMRLNFTKEHDDHGGGH